MATGRTLLLAVDGLAARDAAPLHTLLGTSAAVRITADGTTSAAPTLTSVLTGLPAHRTGITTDLPFTPSRPEERTPWYASALRERTLLDPAHGTTRPEGPARGGTPPGGPARGGTPPGGPGWAGPDTRDHAPVTAALAWPVTAGAPIDLCLPLVEDLRGARHRWEMTERTSSPRMVVEHLRPRRAAGVRISEIAPDDLVTEIAVEALQRSRLDVLAARLTGLGTALRGSGSGSPVVDRARRDTLDLLEQLRDAFAATDEDRVLLLAGAPLVPTTTRVHPNAVLAARGLLRTEGPRVASFRALVWPDGSRGLVHVRAEEGSALRSAALTALRELCRQAPLRLRLVDPEEERSVAGGAPPSRAGGGRVLSPRAGLGDVPPTRPGGGVGEPAEVRTEVIAVLEGEPGTLLGLSATARPVVAGDDPYSAGPLMVGDPWTDGYALLRGPGLPADGEELSWARLGAALTGQLALQA